MHRPNSGVLTRRQMLTLASVLALVQLPNPLLAAGRADMVVYKSPNCGCCSAWAAIMSKAGFAVRVENVEDLAAMRRQAGVPGAVEGCHMAVIDGYVVEGHVPVAAIDKLLVERPAIRGIAVPGMPEGSPGMGDDPGARFDVIAFNHPSGSDVFVYYRAGA